MTTQRSGSTGRGGCIGVLHHERVLLGDPFSHAMWATMKFHWGHAHARGLRRPSILGINACDAPATAIVDGACIDGLMQWCLPWCSHQTCWLAAAVLECQRASSAIRWSGQRHVRCECSFARSALLSTLCDKGMYAATFSLCEHAAVLAPKTTEVRRC